MARVRRKGKKFVLDYRVKGKRKRIEFKDRTEAHELCEKFNALKRAEKVGEFEKLLEARAKLVEIENLFSGKTLSESIFEYGKIKTRGKSRQTQKNEKSDFKKLFNFLSQEKGVHYLKEVTAPMLLEFQQELLTQVSASTVNRRFNGYKNFFNECVDWDYLEKSPARKVQHLKTNPKPRKPLYDDEVTRIAGKIHLNRRRVFLLMAMQGVRPGEACSPRLCDFNRERGTLIVYSGKGSENARVIHLLPASVEIIQDAIDERINVKETDFIFVNQRGKQMRPSVITKAVRDARRALKIPEGKTPYGARHGYATKLERANVNQEKIRRLMGHADIRTTQQYSKLEDRDLKKVVEDTAKVFDFGTGKEVKTVTKSHQTG